MDYILAIDVGTQSLRACIIDSKLSVLERQQIHYRPKVISRNHFEKLAGQLKGICSIRVNIQYRLLFKWDDDRGEADDVCLDDHSYK